MGDSEISTEPPKLEITPELWNPDAAGVWSFVFSPIFGAWLQARNWKELNQVELARKSMLWVYGGFLFFFVMSFDFISLGFARFAGLVFLLSWYFLIGNSQSKYLKDRGVHYEKKAWGTPILIAFAGLVLYALVVFIFAWAAQPSGQNDLINYYNKTMPPLAELEVKVTDGYAAVSGDNFTSDQAMYDALVNTIIPKSSELIESAESVIIPNKDIRRVHEIYLTAINKQQKAFQLIATAIEVGDPAKIDEANALLDEARKGTREFLAENENLKKTYNVVLQ